MKTSKFQAPSSRETSNFKHQSGLWLACLLAVAMGLPFYAGAAGPGSGDAIPALRPPHAEIGLSFWEQYGWVLLVVGLIIVASAVTLTWLLTRPAPPVIMPPEEEARRALTALPPNAMDGATLSRVSQILRHYVRRAFELPLEELTTTEFCRLLADNQEIGPELALLLGGFFRVNDFQKFASLAPTVLEKINPVAQALMLIEKCEARRASLRDTEGAGSTTSFQKRA